MADDITPDMIAEYDQCYAAATESLGHLVLWFVGNRHRDSKDGLPMAVSVVVAAQTLAHDMTSEELASALVIALTHYAAEMEDATP